MCVCKVNGKNWQSDKPSDYYIYSKTDTNRGTYAELRGDTELLLNAVNVNGQDTSGLQFLIRLNPAKTGSYSHNSNSKNYAIYYEGFGSRKMTDAMADNNCTFNVSLNSINEKTQTLTGAFNMVITPKSAGNKWIIDFGQMQNVKFVRK